MVFRDRAPLTYRQHAVTNSSAVIGRGARKLAAWRVCLWGSIEAETQGEIPVGLVACLHAIHGIVEADLDVPLWLLTRSAAAIGAGALNR